MELGTFKSCGLTYVSGMDAYPYGATLDFAFLSSAKEPDRALNHVLKGSFGNRVRGSCLSRPVPLAQIGMTESVTRVRNDRR